MTHSLLAMTQEAGAFPPGPNRNYWAVTEPALARFAALVRAQALEEAAAWLESQRADIPAHGWEFAAAIRDLSTAEVATCKPAT